MDEYQTIDMLKMFISIIKVRLDCMIGDDQDKQNIKNLLDDNISLLNWFLNKYYGTNNDYK